MKIPPFKELNPPDSLGYWTNKKTGEKYGGQYISPLLIPNLKKGKIVISDRYADSSFVYQGYVNKFGIKRAQKLNKGRKNI